MKYSDGHNIITDEDVTLTSTGESLHQVLNNHQEDLAKLKSNVKWIYKYGGVGSGGKGGGGGTGEPAVTATINGTALTAQGSTATLNGPGVYTLNLSMRNPQSHNFQVTIYYPGGTGSTTVDLPNGQGQYLTNVSLNLERNGSISVSAYDRDTGSTTEPVQTNCVVNPYSISYRIVDENKQRVITDLGEAFISNINNSGMYAAIDYNIAIDADVEYSILLNGVSIGNNVISDKQGTVMVPLYEKGTVTQNQSGNYMVDFETRVSPKIAGAQVAVISDQIPYTLLPSELYISCISTKGSIYNSEQDEENAYKHQLSVEITPTIYDGEINNNGEFNVYYKLVTLADYLNNPTVTIGDSESIILKERSNSSKITLSSTVAGCKVLVIRVDGKGADTRSITQAYYIYFADFSQIDYFRTGIDVRDSFFYRAPYVDNRSGFSKYLEQDKIIQNNNGDSIIINGLNTTDNIHTATHISFGIQLSSSHNTDNPLIKIVTQNAQNTITIYQDKVVYGLSGDSSNISPIFIPLSDVLSNQGDYHLITICSKLKKKVGTTNYYERIVFIDGVQENSLLNFQTFDLGVRSIEFLPGNYYINQADVTYLTDTSEIPYSDIDENIYYSAYKQNVLQKSIGGSYDDLLVLLTGQKIDEREWIEVTSDFITKAQEISGVPTLTFEYYPKTDRISGVSDFRTHVDTSFTNENSGKEKFPIHIAYTKANESTVNYYSGNQGIQFWIQFQGSSTRRNISKNFTLGIESDATTTYLFSPNYDASKPATFLPEQSYTLKADVVDSSHSNNVAMGKFINANTEKFNSDSQIKNCLDGFPVLIFVKIFEGETNNSEYKSYYFGIYNFNLGRDSYANLGYYEAQSHQRILNEIKSNQAGNFQVIGVQTGGDTGQPLLMNNRITVAEISDGSDYHDFSQVDNSILFDTDGMSGMWGDIVPGGAQLESTDKPRIQNFVAKVAKAGGYIFRNLLNKTFVDQTYGFHRSLTNSEYDYDSYNGVPDCTKQYRKTLVGDKPTYNLVTSGNFLINNSDLTSTALSSLLTNTPEGDNQFMLNLQSAVEYYTICMAFGLVDSVQKNLNIKTFDAGTSFVIAFYDMDTCLGVDNNGNLVSWFAFSDFWKEDANRNIVVYSDYYPKMTENNATTLPIGYDIPSSYLFAVAKYATLDSSYEDEISPQDLWASWRGSNSVLETADKFIDDYYKALLKDIPDPLFNLNYRFKYLRSSGNSFISDNKNLRGKGIERVRHWLNGRFHLLDAYFNLNSINKPIGYRDNTQASQPWLDHPTMREIVPKSNWASGDQSNTDVIVLHDIFSEDGIQTLKLNGSGKFQFTAREYSPIVVSTGNNLLARYLVTDPEYKYEVDVNLSGNQTIFFGGSSNFTSLTNCGLFVDNSRLVINSKYLQHLQGNNGSISSWTLLTPSLQTLDLNCNGTSATYSGNLAFENDGTTDNYPSLRDIDISKTSINLTVTNESIKSLKLNNVTSDSISINNCNYLTDVEMEGARIGSLTFNPVWDDNIKFNQNSIESINLGGTRGSISITNDSLLSDVTLSNFKEITVQSCQNILTFKIPTSKTATQDDCLESLVLTGASKITSLDLTEHDYLKKLDLTGCSELSELKLHKNAQSRLQYLDISSTKIKEIIWVDEEGNESGQGSIDLSEANALTLSTSKFACKTNSAVEYVKLPNKKVEGEESRFLKDHIAAAVYVGSFKGCVRLKRVYGNFIVNQFECFTGCTQFSIHGQQALYGDLTITDQNVRMPYKLVTGIPNDDAIPTSLYFEASNTRPMDVLFTEDKGENLATNMSFDLNNLDNLFSGTRCTLFDIYYFFSNCNPISIKNPYLTMVGTFGNLITTIRQKIDRYLLHNTKDIIKFDPFNGSTVIAVAQNYESPTMDGDVVVRNDGFYSPLYKTCQELSKSEQGASDRSIAMIDHNFFKGDFEDVDGNKIYCALTQITNLQNVLVSDRTEWTNDLYCQLYNSDNSYVEGDGNFSGMFDECVNLNTIQNSFNVTLYIDFDTLRLPDSLVTLSNSFDSSYGRGTIYLSQTECEKNNGVNYIFSKNNNIAKIQGSTFVINNRDYGQVHLSLTNDTLVDLVNLTNLGSSPTGATMPSYLNGNGLIKTLDDSFPYDIFQPCKQLKVVTGFFSGCQKEFRTFELPGTLYNNLSNLEDASFGLFNIGSDVKLTSNGFKDCPALSNVSYFCSRVKINGFIPSHLFDTGGSSITNMQGAFYYASGIEPYECTNPQSKADYDGVHNTILAEEINATPSYIPAPYFESVGDGEGGSIHTLVKHKLEVGGTIEPVMNYAFAPDLFWYCGNNCNISSIFAGTTQRNSSNGVPTFGISTVVNGLPAYLNAEEVIDRNGGLRGRIPPELFKNGGVSKFDNAFAYCNLLNGYEKNGRSILIPDGIFNGVKTISSAEEMFAGFTFPINVSFKNTFDGMPNGSNIKKLFLHCYFDSEIDEEGNITYCDLTDLNIYQSRLDLQYLFAFNDSTGNYTPGWFDITDQYIKFSNFLTYNHDNLYTNTKYLFMNYSDTLYFDRSILDHIPADKAGQPIRYNFKDRNGKTYSSVQKLIQD